MENKSLEADYQLDCVGLCCPVPLVKLSASMSQLMQGQKLELLGDDQSTQQDLIHWCKSTGNRLISLQTKPDKSFSALIEKKTPQAGS